MAFFEDLGKKVSQTSQDAIKKTKIMAETSKINGQISAEKRVIADSFSKIGEKYFELFCENPDENLAPFVAAVKEAQRKIVDYEDQITRLKGADGCPKCGMEIKEGTVFCPGCGTKIEQPQPAAVPEQAQVRFCKGCGNQLVNGAVFCGNCGARND